MMLGTTNIKRNENQSAVSLLRLGLNENQRTNSVDSDSRSIGLLSRQYVSGENSNGNNRY